MSDKTKAIVLLGLAAVLATLSRVSSPAGAAATVAAISSGSALTPQSVAAIAENLINQYNFNVSPAMATAIAIVESGDVSNPANGFNQYASRYEAGVADTSTGLMQTLTGTAQWLAQQMGYTAYGVPDANALYDPTTSMYFGLAYLDYLSKYAGTMRDPSWIVQSYNAGPGNSSGAYLTKYNKALNWLQTNGVF